MVATIAGPALGIGLAGPSSAEATPKSRPVGVLGIGQRLVAPLDEPVAADTKVAIEAIETPATLATSAARKAAPLPKPKPKAAPRPTAPSRPDAPNVSRSTAASGWKTAKVSWYGPGFYGKNTASGAVLTQGMMNVAHRSLAFGTKIQFEYNGRTCTAVVNDRGPFVGGRTFDLGPGTAKALGFSGVGTVSYRILGR